MADQYTKISDVIVPEIFNQYVIDKTTEKSELVNSGVLVNNPELNKMVAGAGTTFNMPKWNDLTGESQVLSEDKDIEVRKITSHKEVGTKIIRANAWGASDLSGALAGSDPMEAIGDLVSDWWVRDEQKIIMSIINGVFSATSMSGLVDDQSTHGINGELILDAQQKLGDASSLLSMLYMHSATLNELKKQKLIEYQPVPNSEIKIPTYLGFRIICDDSAPVAEGSGNGKIYTTYLLSQGCLQRGSGLPLDIVGTELARDELGSKDVLINRQAKIIHPKGISWGGDSKIAGPTPSNTEFATGTNWTRVADLKKVGLVKLTHLLKEPVAKV